MDCTRLISKSIEHPRCLPAQQLSQMALVAAIGFTSMAPEATPARSTRCDTRAPLGQRWLPTPTTSKIPAPGTEDLRSPKCILVMADCVYLYVCMISIYIYIISCVCWWTDVDVLLSTKEAAGTGFAQDGSGRKHSLAHCSMQFLLILGGSEHRCTTGDHRINCYGKQSSSSSSSSSSCSKSKSSQYKYTIGCDRMRIWMNISRIIYTYL